MREYVRKDAWPEPEAGKPLFSRGQALPSFRTVLQSRAADFWRESRPDLQRQANAHPTLALV